MNRKRRALLIFLIILIPALFIVLQRRTQEVSMLLVNGVIYTVNDAQPEAEAIAVKDGIIVGVGSTEEIRQSFTSLTVIDLQSRPVYPGFIDSHAHMEGLGALVTNLDLGNSKSVEDIQRLVAERAKILPLGSWLRGRGWDQNKWPKKEFPEHHMLDVVAKDIPVYLRRVDGHAVWVNGVVLGAAGVTKGTRDPEGGKIIRDRNGIPTGVFIDNAIDLVESVVPPPSELERTEAMTRAVQGCLKVGLTEVHDMGVDLSGIGIYKKLIGEGKFPFRVYVAIDGIGETWSHYMSTGPETVGHDGRLIVRALKLYADGALGSRGAALIEPYSDDPLNRGLTLTSAEQIRVAASEALERGFQVCTHAIGDRANNIVLNVYGEALKSNEIKARDARFRVEHAQVIDRSDLPRFHSLGVLPMMQPTHCTSDMYWAESRLGPERSKGAYAWRWLLEHGSIVPAGSDFPVESPNPLWGFYAAITRQDHAGWPEGGWHPEQKMTREEALKSFTLWSAFAGFQEKSKGSIEVGKVADLTILSHDIMKIEPRKILDTSVEMTIVAGQVAYSSGVISHNLQSELTPHSSR